MSERKRRFLAPLARHGDGLGYVDRPELAMRDEPECVGPAIVDAQTELAAKYSAIRHAAWVEQARHDRQHLTPRARIADIRRRAKSQHRDFDRELHTIGKMLDRGNQVPAAVRIERLEAILDGPVQNIP